MYILHYVAVLFSVRVVTVEAVRRKVGTLQFEWLLFRELSYMCQVPIPKFSKMGSCIQSMSVS